jgi:hypothetical protein
MTRPPGVPLRRHHRRQHMRCEAGLQRLQPPTCAADPVRKSRAVDINPVPGKDLGLTIERGVVAILADQHMGQQRGARQSLGDGALGRWRLVDRAAGAAALFGAANAQQRRATSERRAPSRIASSRICCLSDSLNIRRRPSRAGGMRGPIGKS